MLNNSEKKDNTIAALEKINQELNRKNTRLNTLMDEMIGDIETIKERSVKVLEENEAEIEKKDNAIVELETKNEELSTVNETLNQEIQNKEQILQGKDKKLKIQQTQNNELSATIQKKQAEIEMLNRSIDEIVEDLASIKESKCWLYTKPLRDIRQVFEGEKG